MKITNAGLVYIYARMLDFHQRRQVWKNLVFVLPRHVRVAHNDHLAPEDILFEPLTSRTCAAEAVLSV